jgi:hypothetical protein
MYPFSISWRLQKIDEWKKKANAASKYRGVYKFPPPRGFYSQSTHPLTGKIVYISYNPDDKVCALAYDRQMLKWWGRYVGLFSFVRV